MQEYLEKLNPQQREAAMCINGPLLMIAGAGSGKTTTLINRVAYMVDSGIDPESILLLTFTNEAARNMVEKAAKTANPACKNITACTYHSFCANMLRKFGDRIGLNRNFDILSSTDCEDVIGMIKAKNPSVFMQAYGFPGNKTVISILSKAVNTGNIAPNNLEAMIIRDYPKAAPFFRELLWLFDAYNQYKLENSKLDYDDLLVFMRKLLNDPTAKQLIQEKYKYIMVDEYQDTNYLQEEIIMSLADKYRNLAVVGDDYQSIYRFRGSDINNILNFPDKMTGCKKVILDTNYRSTHQILDVANCMMKNHADFGFSKDMKDADKSGKKVRIAKPISAEEEAEVVLTKIKKNLKNGTKPNEIAVLMRKTSSSHLLEASLNTEGIPYIKKGGIKFLEHQCIRDIIAYLKLLNNPNDELSWIRILKTLPGIGNTYSARIAACCNNPDFLMQFPRKIFHPHLVALNEFLNLLHNETDFQTLYNKICDFYFHYRQMAVDNLITSDESNRTEMQEELNEDKLLSQSLWQIAENYPSATSFLDSLILDPNQQKEEKDCIILSTIHSAKGLEWDKVYMLDCVEGIFPSVSEKTGDKEEADEELRCFYVAVTRARESLTIFCPVTTKSNGKNYGGLPDILKESTRYAKIVESSSKQMQMYDLSVPFAQKDIAKVAGARWNPVERVWQASGDVLDKNPHLHRFLPYDSPYRQQNEEEMER